MPSPDLLRVSAQDGQFEKIVIWLQVADEHGLDVQLNMPHAGLAPVASPQAAQAVSPDADFNQRLAQLRGK